MTNGLAIQKTSTLFQSRYDAECARVHRYMKIIMALQWALGIAFAFIWAPKTWIGSHQEVHIHVWASIVIGTSLSGFAIGWMSFFPTKTITRHIVAITQVLWSALLIHLSGGRIETHFHVFASLAILSTYRDWKILISATVVVAADHFIRGVFYPASVFGVFSESPYRWMEHAAWVLFEVAILAPGCYRLRNEILELCKRQSELEEAKRDVDYQVEQRTYELFNALEQLKEKTLEAERLALVAKYTENGVVITDSHLNIEWVNSGYSRLTGYSPEEAIGKRQSDLSHGPDTDPIIIENMNQAVEMKEGFHGELINHRKDGTPYWLSFELRPIFNVEGEVVRFIGVQSDITKRKQIELSLADAEKRLRSTVNNVPGAFYRRILDRDLSEKTEFVSDYIQILTGYSSDEFKGDEGFNLTQFVHPDDIESLKTALKDSLENSAEFEIEYRILAKDNSINWVLEKGRCEPVRTNGRNQFVIDGMFFDITDRVEAETRNRQLQAELVDASRQAGMAEIATGVLHNVGNVLNSLNVSASMIRKKIAASPIDKLDKVSNILVQHTSAMGDFMDHDPVGQKIPEYIQKLSNELQLQHEIVDTEFTALLQNVEHIKQIINEQQTTANSVRPTQDLCPKELVSSALSANKHLIEQHNVSVETEYKSNVNVHSDKHGILQILINLIKNAVEATLDNDSGERSISLNISTSTEWMVFEVTDSGIGIPDENLRKIFQHGFSTKENGHGFGLHSCANVATELGGNLTATSEGPGKGSQFRFQLPLMPAHKKDSNHQVTALAPFDSPATGNLETNEPLPSSPTIRH